VATRQVHSRDRLAGFFWPDVPERNALSSLRTALYALGVLVVLLLEKAFEARHEADGVLRALAGILRHEDIPHVIANTIVAMSALLVFNLLSLIRKRLGPGALLGVLRAPAGTVD
jgi:hypothetical protein